MVLSVTNLVLNSSGGVDDVDVAERLDYCLGGGSRRRMVILSIIANH